MKQFTIYLNENKEQQKVDILVIVDVQEEFSKFIPKNFVTNLIEYSKHFSTVIQIWDSNDATKPSYKFANQKGIYIKKFGTKFSDDLVDTVAKLDKKYPNAKEGDIFEFDDVDSYVVRIANKHRWFYVPAKMATLFKSLKGKSVVVVGGADDECIRDVYEAMESFGIKVQYNKAYMYSAKNNNSQTHNPKTQEQTL
jgi:hypothetical protein